MRLIRPFTVNDAALLSSSIGESGAVALEGDMTDGNDAELLEGDATGLLLFEGDEAASLEWDSGTTYALGDTVVVTDTNYHHAFESLADSNTNKPPRDNPDYWVDLGASNRWAMFDQYNTSQSSAPGEIEVEIETTGRIDIIALLNISAATVQIVSNDAIDGEIFNQTFSMVSTAGITDWYAYFFEEIIRKGDLVVDLPPYVGQTVTVTFTDTDAIVKVGTLILGQVKNIGGTVYGATVGITDYSRKDTDDFGNYTIVERAFSKRGEFKVWTDTNLFDEIQRVLALYRATPIVYLGTDEFASTQVYGFYKSFDLEFTGPNKSYCTLEIEGLT
jgi:hypothetical protein